MSPLASAIVLFALAVVIVALFAARLRRAAADELAILPQPEPARSPAPLDGALLAGD